MIDFESTDRSRQVVQELAPHWQILTVPSEYFSAKATDDLVSKVESGIEGVKITLTVTEFFFGNPKDMQGDPEFVQGIDLVRTPDTPFDINKDFIDQLTTGVSEEVSMSYRPSFMGRALHVKPVRYSVGRHFKGFFGDKLILRVANCFVSNEMVERRLQIQTRIPSEEIESGFGIQHVFRRGVDGKNQLYELARQLSLAARDVGAEINSVKALEGRDPKLLEPISVQSEIRRLQRLRHSLETENYDLRCQLDQSHDHSRRLQLQLEEICASRSWRWTLPLRKLHRR